MADGTTTAPEAAQTDDELLEVDQVAQILKVHPNTVRALGDRGELAYLRVGRQRRIWRSALNAYLAAASTRTEAAS